MRRTIPVLAAALVLLAFANAGERGTRAMTGWFNVTTPEGWNGRRYMDGDSIFAEEFDSTGNGRIDVWRFYRRGLLSSEERDLDNDGRVDLQTHWEARTVRLLSVFRDTNRRGVNDLEIEATTNRRWEIREDRNLDGIADRILIVNGPPDLFDFLEIDLATQRNVIDVVPREFWEELQTDDGYTGNITAYYRFTRGELSHRGSWDTRGRFTWVRGGTDYTPPPPPPPQVPDGQLAVIPAPAPAPAPQYYGRDDVRNPFDLQAGGVDPYAYMDGGQAGGPVYDPYQTLDPVPAPVPTTPYGYPPQPDPYYQPPGRFGRDRTQYEGLPPGDSAARSVPARMRPPGTSSGSSRR